MINQLLTPYGGNPSLLLLQNTMTTELHLYKWFSDALSHNYKPHSNYQFSSTLISSFFIFTSLTSRSPAFLRTCSHLFPLIEPCSHFSSPHQNLTQPVHSHCLSSHINFLHTHQKSTCGISKWAIQHQETKEAATGETSVWWAANHCRVDINSWCD